ncbi:MAG: TetR/AcrR family transcriptional regulator [Lachnospiraceae bacterium]|nr:TetR/AcrR family transcriptional regulator [Lachnospiraceae bacterium]
MPRDKTENHIKIMAAAKEEFLEYGYEKASMRGIADRCGLTAAGIYRHCKDKEDLFCQLVSPSEEKLKKWAGGHLRRYEELVASGQKKGKKITWQDSNIDMMREVVYPNMVDYHILIAKSKGSRYENFLHDMTEESQNRFLSYLEELRTAGFNTPNISPRQLHLLLTAYLTALFEPVVHNYSYEEAVAALETLEKFFLPGWKQLMDL